MRHHDVVFKRVEDADGTLALFACHPDEQAETFDELSEHALVLSLDDTRAVSMWPESYGDLAALRQAFAAGWRRGTFGDWKRNKLDYEASVLERSRLWATMPDVASEVLMLSAAIPGFTTLADLMVTRDPLANGFGFVIVDRVYAVQWAETNGGLMLRVFAYFEAHVPIADPDERWRFDERWQLLCERERVRPVVSRPVRLVGGFWDPILIDEWRWGGRLGEASTPDADDVVVFRALLAFMWTAATAAAQGWEPIAGLQAVETEVPLGDGMVPVCVLDRPDGYVEPEGGAADVAALVDEWFEDEDNPPDVQFGLLD